jgi:hypothetical protein
MRNCALSLLSIVLSCCGNSQAQSPARSPRTSSRIRTEPEIRSRVIINPVFATGMVCDGVTDDSAALQAALASAANPNLGNATVIMPPGTCIINPAVVSINASIWLQGAGGFGTTLKRKNSSSGSPILLINSNGITFSDFAIDGNKGGPGIATQADSIATGTPFSGITIERMRFVNSTNNDIVSYVTAPGSYSANWLIADNEFDNQGNPFSSCAVSGACANILVRNPLRVRVIGNRSNTCENFALFSSIPGGGQVEIGQNDVSNLGGFGVALGGGVLGSAGAHIHHNLFTTTNADPSNLIDMAFWNDFLVDHNILYHNGIAAPAPAMAGEPVACIADFPPADHGEVDSNFCYVSPTMARNVIGIGLGGNDISITNNFIQGASSAGISVAVGSQGPARGVRVIGNTTKNNNQQSPGSHAGIELFLGVGAPDLAALSDVIIQGNHSYDDQPIKTQGYGIGIALFGDRTRFANITIENNDVTGNKVGGLLNNASPFTGFVIRNNFGYNPVGTIAAPDFPASGAGPQINDTGYDVTVYITSGTHPIAIAIHGTTLTGVFVPGGGVVSGPIRLPANQDITLTYTAGGAPSWQWIAD